MRHTGKATLGSVPGRLIGSHRLPGGTFASPAPQWIPLSVHVGQEVSQPGKNGQSAAEASTPHDAISSRHRRVTVAVGRE